MHIQHLDASDVLFVIVQDLDKFFSFLIIKYYIILY